MTQRSSKLDAAAREALLAVYELGTRDRPADAGRVARTLGVSSVEAATLLLELDRRGLVWAEKCRLTMKGLALAVRESTRRSAKRRAA